MIFLRFPMQHALSLIEQSRHNYYMVLEFVRFCFSRIPLQDSHTDLTSCHTVLSRHPFQLVHPSHTAKDDIGIITFYYG